MKPIRILILLFLVLLGSGLAMAFIDKGDGTLYSPASTNVGVNVQNPTVKLDVNGQVMIRGGSPGSGKLLQSNAAGKASWVTVSSIDNASTLDGLDSSQFLRSDTSDSFSSGTLTIDAGTTFDINSTNVSIADTDITLDGASTTFTQTTGAITMSPANGSNMNFPLYGNSRFVIDTDKFVLDKNGNIGVATASPEFRLDVVGQAKFRNGIYVVGTNPVIINGTAADNKDITYKVGNLDRWIIRVSGSESANNDGSDFSIISRMDDGSALNTPIAITRKTSLVTFTNSIDINGAVTVSGYGATVINEGGNAVNFRTESDTDANALTVNGTTNNIGIGTLNPTRKLHVVGAILASGSLQGKSLTVNGNSLSTAALSQGSLLYTKTAANLKELAKGTNHYCLKVNGNTLAYEGCGTGDVSGGSSSVNNGIALFSSTTGKAIKDSGIRLFTRSQTSLYLGNGAGLYSNGTTIGNTGFGFNAVAGSSGFTGDYNTGFGTNALKNLTYGNGNVGVATGAGLAVTTATRNIFIGLNSGFAFATGDRNTFIGAHALTTATNGHYNTLIGGRVGIAKSSGAFSSNTIVGEWGWSAAGTDSHNNTGLGKSVLSAVTNGDNNVALGYNAGDNITTGSGNIVIGYNIDAPSATGSNQLTIANLIYGNGNSATATTVSSGKVGIRKPNPTATLDVNGTFLTKTAAFFSEYSIGNSGTSKTVDWGNGNRQYITMTGNCTFTFTAPTGVTTLLLRLIQDGTGSRTATWPATVKWPSGSAPTLTTTASAVDIVTCYYNGTNYYCNSSLNFQ